MTVVPAQRTENSCDVRALITQCWIAATLIASGRPHNVPGRGVLVRLAALLDDYSRLIRYMREGGTFPKVAFTREAAQAANFALKAMAEDCGEWCSLCGLIGDNQLGAIPVLALNLRELAGTVSQDTAHFLEPLLSQMIKVSNPAAPAHSC